MKLLPKNRFALLLNLLAYYVVLGFLIRLTFFVISFQSVGLSLWNLLRIFGLGLIFDIGTGIFFVLFYAFYLLVLPSRLIGSWVDKSITYFILFLTVFILFFSHLAEFPFWAEFHTRFNFIAVDYLIYTYEVFSNINESYPLPVLIVSLLLLTLLVFFIFRKRGVFKSIFSDKMPVKKRLRYVLPLVLVALVYIQFIPNKWAETTDNRYVNEISKNGIYAFFAAYRSNELDYETFYLQLPNIAAFKQVKKAISQPNQQYLSHEFSNLDRKVTNPGPEIRPNIVLICIESFSAEFMTAFGNEQQLTPNLDQLSSQSLFFTNLYATGTRTIRGMEALTLSVPPTPGNSIVRRPGNADLYSIATVFRQKGYGLEFIYGGDGYFDNMNNFFGGQGFTIVDRNRGNPLSDDIKTQRINIEDKDVTFENAWGICDEDIYQQSIKQADANYMKSKPFFQFIMTTSNHKPFSFPPKKIDMEQGSREAAVKYTDYAIGKFLAQAKTKPWFANTVFVIIADHCASSAGKWEININSHHIPAMIYNLRQQPAQQISKQVSQIDIMPTLFGYLNWTYTTSLYGKDIRLMGKDDERAFLGNYRTLGFLKGDTFTEINDRKQCNQYHWDAAKNEMKALPKADKILKDQTIIHYQTASYRFKYGKMKAKK